MRYKVQEKYIGKKAQEKIRKATIAVVGVGALGSMATNLLARAGIGKIILYDDDKVELQNLQRQFLYDEKDINEEKVFAAEKKLKDINSGVKIIPKNQRLNSKNILLSADIVLDCTDNPDSKFLLNRYCKEKNIPLISASVAGLSGNILAITKGSACFSCVFGKKKGFLDAENSGLLNSAAAVVSAIQANEAIKIIVGKNPEKDMLHINLETNEIKKIKLRRDKKCKVCKNDGYN
jgi:molybdopterin-synthase adenylyltransferase